MSPGVFQRILRVCGCLRFVKSAKVSHPRSYIDCKKTLGIVRRTWQAAVHAELDDAPPIRLCFTWRLCVRPSVCLLATSRKNYWSNLRKNFIIDIFGQRRPTKYWKSSGSRVHPDSRIRTEFVWAEVCGLRVLCVNAMTVQFINVIVGWRRGTARQSLFLVLLSCCSFVPNFILADPGGGRSATQPILACRHYGRPRVDHTWCIWQFSPAQVFHIIIIMMYGNFRG